VAVALVSVLFVLALVAALVLLQSRNSLTRRLGAARADADRAQGALAAAVAERDELRDKVTWLDAANGRVADDLERQRERSEELAVLLEAATTGGGAATGPGAEAVVTGDGDDAGGSTGGDGVWRLLLAHITRRWAAVVGVPPAHRHLAEGPLAAQITQALTRQAERLREEVGVDVELTVTAPIEPALRMPFLLAAVELMEALAASAERITVEVDGRLVLVGDGWVDVAGEVAAACDRAVNAGARVDVLEPRPEQVRLEITA
jgi:hypothetical protein